MTTDAIAVGAEALRKARESHRSRPDAPARGPRKNSPGSNGSGNSKPKASLADAAPADPHPPVDGLPECETCGGIRWVRVDVPVGHRQYGQLTRCPECGALAERKRRRAVYERKRQRIERYTQRVGRYGRQTFETFDRRTGEARTEHVREALEAALRFAEVHEGWLVLTGTKGTGKTHLASAICNYLENEPVPPEEKPLTMYVTAPDLLDLLRSGYDDANDDHQELLELCRGVDVLIMDDLGVESSSSAWVREKLYSVLNYRYQAELPTVVVTNDRLDDLPARLRSRLSDDRLCKHVETVAPDYRQHNRSPGTIVY